MLREIDRVFNCLLGANRLGVNRLGDLTTGYQLFAQRSSQGIIFKFFAFGTTYLAVEIISFNVNTCSYLVLPCQNKNLVIIVCILRRITAISLKQSLTYF